MKCNYFNFSVHKYNLYYLQQAIWNFTSPRLYAHSAMWTVDENLPEESRGAVTKW
jgi:hypothetical protein